MASSELNPSLSDMEIMILRYVRAFHATLNFKEILKCSSNMELELNDIGVVRNPVAKRLLGHHSRDDILLLNPKAGFYRT